MTRRIHNAWVAFEKAAIPQGAGQAQRRSMRDAFYGGAQALLSGILGMLSPDEPTAEDLVKMGEITRELRDYRDELVARVAGDSQRAAGFVRNNNQ